MNWFGGTVGGIEVTDHLIFQFTGAENELNFQAKLGPELIKSFRWASWIYSRMRYIDPDGDYGHQNINMRLFKRL